MYRFFFRLFLFCIFKKIDKNCWKIHEFYKIVITENYGSICVVLPSIIVKEDSK